MNKKILIILFGLVLIVGAAALLNRQNIEGKAASQREAILFIRAGDFETQVDFETILELETAQFDEELRGGGQPAQAVNFTGVRLKDLLEKVGVETEGKTQVITKAADGYAVALSMEEVLEDDNVYLAYKMNGVDLGKKEDGGTGPYRLIIRQDTFAQRWVKFLM